MTDNKNDKTKVDLGLLEEDDEFEEFPAEGTYLDLLMVILAWRKHNLKIADSFHLDWTAKDEDNEDISVWEDNWDDDDVEDDFNQQLRYYFAIMSFIKKFVQR